MRRDVKMRRCEDEQMWRWADVKMSRCEDVKMRKWEVVKMRRCEDDVKMKKMRRWEAVKMRRCEDEKLWRWEDEIQTPTIGRTLRSDALGNNRCGFLKSRYGGVFGKPWATGCYRSRFGAMIIVIVTIRNNKTVPWWLGSGHVMSHSDIQHSKAI